MGRVYTKEVQTAYHYGTHEISFQTATGFGNPYFDVNFQVRFRRPDGSDVVVEGFYDGVNFFKARAYCDMVGTWEWVTRSTHTDLNGKSGSFEVVNSLLKGKLKINPEDYYQFAYDNGDWFLHIGDTGYRYVSNGEPFWKEYIDQAAASGITKIRVWCSQDRSNVQAFFQYDREYLNLTYWHEIDRRLVYALEHYPEVNIQLIIFAEDSEEVKRYLRGDSITRLAVRHMQARFSSFANIYWCISNDFRLEKGVSNFFERDGQDDNDGEELIEGIDLIGKEILTNERWGTLITNHQSRFSGYHFLDASWSDITTIEDLGQVTGEKILEYRSKGTQPIVLDEDRYECWRNAKHDRYFFRRLMWSSLLSGGHATYGGLKTFEQYDGGLCGMYGYFDAYREGKLEQGAHDFIHIHKFFKDSGITLVGMVPADIAAESKPLLFKVMEAQDKQKYIVYLANPDSYEGHFPDGFNGFYTDEIADENSEVPSVKLCIGEGVYKISWFDPSSGQWFEGGTAMGGNCTLTAPGAGDWVLLLVKLLN